MLQYSIEHFQNLQEITPVAIHCSGWLLDTENLPTQIRLEGHSTDKSQIDVLRTDRLDAAKMLRSQNIRCGFEIEILTNAPEDFDLIFSNGKENISIPLKDLKAGMSFIKPTKNIKIASILKKCRLFFLFLLYLPIRVLKVIKNKLFKIFPGFQKFYLRYIYSLLHPGSYRAFSPEVKPISRNPFWGEHILLISHFADGSGAPMLLLNIARTLHGFGFHLHIVLMRDGELHESFSQLGSVDVVKSENEFRQKLRQWQHDGICIRKAFLNTTMAGIYAKLLKEFNMTVINLIHEMPATVTAMGQYEAASVLQKNADKIVIPSSLIQELWAETDFPLPADNCVILPQPDYHNDLEPVKDEIEKAHCHTALCQELNIPEDSYIVIGCGMLETRKAPDVFFKTAFKVCELDPKVRFIWIGDLGDPFYRKKISLMLEKYPDNTKLLSYRNLNNYYRGADLFFLPSTEDPFPTVGLLAAKVAMPVVFCRQNTGLRDLFGQIEGCSSAEYSVEIFKKLILRLAADRAFSISQGIAFQKIYQEKMYSFSSYVQSLYELTGDRLPRITAIVPNYNYAKFLPVRIKTIADQTFPIYELLILDDCSKDNSAEVAKQLIQQYKKHFPGGMRYIPHSENAGVFRQWFKGVSLAQGDFIWIAEADDMCRNNMQSHLIHAFDDPAVQIAYAQSALIDSDDKIYAKTFLYHTDNISKNKWQQDFIWDAETEIETSLAIKNSIPNASGALFRKTAFSNIPQELFSYKVVGDWFAYLHMIQGGKIAFCAKPLNLYRRHPGSVVAKNPEILLEELNKLYAFICSKFAVSNYTKAQMQRELNQTCLMLKASLNDQYSKIDAFNESQATEYWMLPPDTDWKLFKNKISQSKAVYLFICLSNCNSSLPDHIAESFNGSIHVFWRDDLKNNDFIEKFVLWKNDDFKNHA